MLSLTCRSYQSCHFEVDQPHVKIRNIHQLRVRNINFYFLIIIVPSCNLALKLSLVASLASRPTNISEFYFRKNFRLCLHRCTLPIFHKMNSIFRKISYYLVYISTNITNLCELCSLYFLQMVSSQVLPIALLFLFYLHQLVQSSVYFWE